MYPLTDDQEMDKSDTNRLLINRWNGRNATIASPTSEIHFEARQNDE